MHFVKRKESGGRWTDGQRDGRTEGRMIEAGGQNGGEG